ncbi:hypothetical protein GCM10023185_11540 [Hymenobacter saemangeumensis]|uniref:Staphylococcus aureus surface protein A n=1 Tax=Hymenobacter saemangeumensis TaxID=1084522 RepID=A0ABP8I6I4_9BACT
MNPSGGDNTAFVDLVEIVRSSDNVVMSGAVANPSFETFNSLANGVYGYNPTGASWVFVGNNGAGISQAGPVGGFDPPSAGAVGSYVGFIQQYASIQQTLALAPGTYYVRLRGAQRYNCCGGSSFNQTLNILVNGQSLGMVQPPNNNAFTTYATSTFTVAAAPGNALAFDGANDYVRVANNMPATGDFTLEGWVNPAAFGGLTSFIMADNFPTGAMHCQFSGNNLAFSVSGNNPTDIVSTSALPTGRWSHVAVVYSAGPRTVNIYVNGALNTSATYTTAQTIAALPYGIGGWLSGGTPQRFFNGSYDEVRMYTTTLTQAQIQADMVSTSSALPGSLSAYFDFDQGIAGGSNGSITTAYSQVNNTTGTLNNFALTGSTSNWVESYAMVRPTATAATAITGSSFTANWTAPVIGTVDNGYRLEVSTSPTFATTIAGSPFTVFGTSQTITGLSQTTTYYYRVRADKSTVTGQGANSGTTTVTTLALPTIASVAVNPGGLGQSITITGTNLSSPTALTINGVNALAGIISNNGSTLVVRVPLTSATTGNVSITTAGGTATSGTFNVMAAPGNALAFDGVDDLVNVPMTSALQFGTGNFTFEAWVRSSAVDVRVALGSLGGGQDYWMGFSSGRGAVSVSGTTCVGTTSINDNRWHHLAGVRNGTQLTIYVDGTAETTIFNNLSASPTTALGIGHFGGGGYNWPGSIDEVRIYNIALTAANVRTDMLSTSSVAPASLRLHYNFDQGIPSGNNAGLTTMYDLAGGTAATLSNFALTGSTSNWVESYAMVRPTATAATGNTGTGFTANWTAPAIGIVTNYLLDVSTSATFATAIAGSPFTVAGGTTSRSITGLAPNTTYYYRVRADKTSVTNQGAASNAIGVTVMTPPGNALAFDGVNDYVNLPAGLTASASSFTFEAWVNYTDNGYWTRIFDFGNGSAGSYMFLTPRTAWGTGFDENIGFAITTAGGANEQRVTTNAVMPTRWSHVAVTLSPNGNGTTTCTIYLNGVVIGTNANLTLNAASLGNLANNWLGRSLYGVDPYLRGSMDEVRLWSTARSQAQIQSDMVSIPAFPTAGLLAYYDFDQGVPSGANASITELYDQANGNTGTLNNFALTAGNSTSNWVESYAMVRPTATAATAVTGSSFTANWTAPVIGTVDNGYRLEVSTSPTFATTIAGSPFTVSGTSQTVTGLAANTTYFYRVRADKTSVTNQGAFSNTQSAATMVAPGNALAFDGINDNVVFSSTPAVNSLGTGNFTMEAWVYYNGSSAAQSIIRKTGDYNLYINGNTLHAEVWPNGLGNATWRRAAGAITLPANRWVHVAAVWTAATSNCQLYVNGVADGTGASTLGSISGSESLMLGLSSIYGNALGGRLDEVRIYTAALTAANVQADMTSTAASVPGSLQFYVDLDQGIASGNNAGVTTVYDRANNYTGTLNNFALTAGNSTSNWVESYAMVRPTPTAATLVTGNSFTANWTAPAIGIVTNYLLDVSTSATFATAIAGSPFTVAGGTTSRSITGLAPNTTYYYRVRADKTSVTGQGAFSGTITATTTSCTTTAIAQNVTASLNAAGTATITAAQVNNGSSSTCAPITTSVAPSTFTCADVTPSDATNPALNFNGTNQYAEGTNPLLPLGNAARTLEAWVNPNTAGQGAVIFNYGTPTSNQRSGLLISGGRLYYVGEFNDQVGVSVLPVGTWSHVAATYDGTTLRLYVNGVLEATKSQAGNPFNTTGTTLRIGRRSLPQDGEYLNGRVDEVRVWNRQLTAAEITQSAARTNPTSLAGLVARYAMSEGSGTTTADFMGNGTAATLFNAPTWLTPGVAYSTPMTVLTVADANGNTSRAAAIVTVTDGIAPTVVTQNITVQLSAAGTASITAAQVNNGSSDNCTPTANLTLSVSPSNFTCANATASTANQYALDLDGVNDYVNLGGGNILTGGSYTKEAWVFARANDCRNILSSNNQHQMWLQSSLQGGNGTAYGTVQDPSGAFPLNTWIHVAVTYDQPTSTMRLYRNGTLIATNTAAVAYTGGLIQIGAHGSNCNFNGLIDEVRIWNSARTAAQIAATRTVTLAGNEDGLLAYYNFENGPNSGTLTDASGNGRTGTLVNMATATAWVASTAPITGGTPTVVTLTVTDANGNSNTGTAQVSVIAPTPTITTLSPSTTSVGTTVTVTGTNLSGATALTVNGAAATISNLTSTGFTFVVPAAAAASGNVVVTTDPCSQTASSPFTVLTAPANALSFDGTNDLVSIPHNNAFNITGAITLEAWVRTSLTTGAEQYITTKNESSWYLALNGGGGLTGVASFFLNNVSPGGGWLYGTTNLTDGRWHHVAGTYDGATLRLYVDGVLENSRAATGAIATGTSPVLIGGRPSGIFNGSIDELRIYNQALSLAQLRADMVSTNPALPGNLVAYFNFDQGTPGGNNTGLTTLYDRSGTYAGTLNNFALTGSTSNWVESYAMVLPTPTAATAITSTGFTANWTAPAIGTANSYFLDVATNPTFTAGLATFSIAAPTASFAVTGRTPGTQYYYRLRADKTTVANQGGARDNIAVTTLSNVATLSNLTLSAGALSPAFASATTTYSVATTGTSTTVTPTVTQAGATVTVNGTAVTSGSASASIPLSIGANNITVLVTAQDGTTQTAYVVTVTRNCVVTAIAQNITVNLNASGTVSVPATSVNNGSSSTCAPVSLGFQAQGTVGAMVGEGGTLSLTAPAGATFTAVTFASYGLPNGSPGSYTYGSCHSTTSKSAVESYLLGNGGTINIPATNAVFGDPCLFITKRLAVQATYTFGSPVTQLNYTCANVGANNVTLTVTDANGNFATAPATITVVDNTAPVFTACGAGTSASPFTSLNCARTVTTTGVYWFTISGNTFQGYVDATTDGGGWVEILNYVHQGGTNPALNVRTTSLPLQTAAGLGTNEGGTAAWGHAAPSLVNSLNPQELRFYGQTSAHGRVIHFKTSHAPTLSYFRTGTGNTQGINNSFTALPGHTANIPAQAVDFWTNQGNLAMTNFPFWLSSTYHWGIQGGGNRWEVDDYPNNFSQSTIHRIFVRGSATASIGTPVVASNTTGQCGANVTLTGTQAVTDNCGAPTVTFSPASGSFFNVGTTPVTATATDASGNSSNITFNVTVNDTQAPTITCPAAVVSCSNTPALGTPTVSDNCAVATTTNNAPATFPNGATTVTWTVTDVNGLTATCTQSVTVTPAPAAPTAPSASRCGTGTVTLTASGAPSGGSYAWYTAASGGTPVATTPSYTTPSISATTTYYVSAITSAASGSCEGPRTAVAAIVNSNPTVSITASGPTAICPGGSVNLTASTSALSATSIPYAPLSGTATNGPVGDDAMMNVVLPFSFTYGGTAYTSVNISTNGNIQFPPSNSAQFTPQPIPTAGGPDNYIALAWSDWFPISAGQVTYFTTGVAPNRRFVVHYNTPHITNDGALNGQIILFEGTNVAELHIGTQSNAGNTKVQGYENVDGTAGLAIAGRNNTTWQASNEAWRLTPAATTYTWSPAAGLNTTSGATVTASPTTTTTYTVTANDGNCTGTTTQTITVYPVAAAPTTTSASRCGTGTVTLSAAGAPTGGSYAWYTVATGGTAIAGQTASTYTTPSLSATTTYYVSVLNSAANGSCESTRTAVTATINTVPTAPTATGASRCGTGTVTLSAAGAPTGGSYAWYTVATGGTAIAGATASTYTTPSISATTTYYVSVLNSAANGSCESTRTAVTATVNTAPAFTACPGNQSANAASGSCTAVVSYTATASGSPASTITYAFSGATTGSGSGTGSGSTFNGGVTTVTLTAANGCAPATCTFTVTVNDTQAPVITCPAPITVAAAAGTCGAPVTYTAPTATDNCGGAPQTITQPAYNNPYSGLARGYYFTAPSSFVITGLQVPTDASTGPQSIQVMRFAASPPDYSATASYTALLYYTNSNTTTGNIPVNIPVAAGEVIGILGVRGADVNSYASSASATITINGTPVTINRLITQNTISTGQAPQNSYSGDPSGQLSRVFFTYAPSSITVTQTAGLASGATFPVGTTTNTFTATDASGNSSTCSFNVTVNDTQVPTVVTQNISVSLDASGAVTVTGAQVNNGSSDNCTPAANLTLSVSPSSFTCANVGPNTVTLTVTDAAGNSSTGTATVTVVDNTAPSTNLLPNAPALALSNVPEAANYGVLYQLNIPNAANFNSLPGVPYAVNNSGVSMPTPARVAYFMEVEQGGVSKWVWASMNNFASTLTQLGFPHPAQNPVSWAQSVTGLNVAASSNAGVATGTNVGTGRLEMWRFNYGPENVAGIAGASNTLYDYSDRNDNVNNYGSFQVHNVTAAQTLFAYNNWGGNGGNSDLGIGNNPGTHPDWTFTNNAGTYAVKRIYILVPNSSAPGGSFTQPATLALGANGTATLLASQVYAGNASDNCGTVTASVTPSSFTCAELGSNTVTVTLTDGNGNSVSQPATVTVTAPPAATLTNATPNPAMVGTTVTVTGTNLSAATALTVNGAAATISSLTNTGFTFVVPAGATNNGNIVLTTPCSQSVTRAFTVRPSLSNLVVSAGAISPVFAPATLSYSLTVPGTTTSTTVTPTNAQTSGGVITVNGTAVTSGTASGSIALNPGTNTITVVVNPVGGGTATTYTVTITRTPCAVTAIAQNLTVNLNASGSATVTAAQINNGSSSTCGAVTLSLGDLTERFTNGGFDTSATGWTGANIDGNGGYRTTGGNPGGMFILNDAGQVATDPSISQTVTGLTPGTAYIIRGDYRTFYTNSVGVTAFAIDVNGTQALALPSPGQTWTAFSLGFTATATSQTIRFRGEINGTDIDIAVDNLSLRQAASSVTFTCANVGANPVTLLVTDNFGGSATALATVTVVDNIAPTAVAQNLTVNLDASGTATVTAAMLNNGSTDNCSPIVLGVQRTGTVGAVVTEGGNLTLTAPAGTVFTAVTFASYGLPNGSPGSFTLGSCHASSSQSVVTSYVVGNSGTVVIPATNAVFTDPCFGIQKRLAVQATYQWAGTPAAQVSFDCSEVGAQPVRLTVTDPSGNTSTATATVTVVDNTAPTVIAQNVTASLNAAGTATITAAQVNNGSTDNCASTLSYAIAPSTFTCADVVPSSATNTALNFNGSGQYVALPATTPVPVGNSAYTIEAWIKPNQMGTYGIIGWGNYGTTNQVTALRLSPTGIHHYWWANDLGATTASLVGAWHHVAASFDGTTRRLYLDGVLIGSDNPTGHAVPNASNLRIASTCPGPCGGEFFPGAIDEVRVWSRSLTNAEVSSSAARTNPASLAGLVVRYAMSEGTGSTTADFIGNGAAGTLVGSPTWVTPGVAYTSPMTVLSVTDASNNTTRAAANVTVTDALAPTAIAQTVNVTVDATGRAYVSAASVNNGSTDNCAVTNVALSTSAFGNCAASAALTFDGVDDYVSLPHNAAYNVTSALTVEAWIRTSVTGEKYITTKGENSWYLAMNGGGGLPGVASFWINNVSTNSGGWLYGTTNMADGNWHHVAGTYDGATLRLYVDGVLQNSRNAVNSIPNGTNPVLIGGRPGQPWNGNIDEVRIWNVARTAAELNLYRDKAVAGNSAGLLAYVDFNEAAGSSTVANRGSVGGTGTLLNFGTTTATAFQAPGMLPALGTGAQTVTLTVSDASGNVSTTTATVNVSVPVLTTTTWTGNASTDWTDCRNWSQGVLPSTTISAMVPASMPRYPVLPAGNYPVNNMTVAAGASLTMNTGSTLQVNGNWANNGTATLTGTVAFVGSAAQTAGGSSATAFATVTVNKAAGTVTLTRDMAVNTALTVSSGTLTTTSAYTVQLAPVATITESETAYVIGNVEMTRNLNTAGVSTSFGGLGLTLQPDASSTALPGSTRVIRTTGTAVSGVNGSVSIQRYFDIQATVNTGLNVNMTFGYFEHELNGIAEANLALFKSGAGLGGQWTPMRYITRDAAANTVYRPAITSFSIWTLGNELAPLPVELLTFTAVKQGTKVELNWRTATERNSSHFDVERSRDGRSFEHIGSRVAQGNSNSPTDYALTDANYPGETNTLYYRLKQVDLDGTFTYSPVRTVQLGRSLTTLEVYPNPAKAAVTVIGAVAGAPVVVYDALGRAIVQAKADADGAARLSLPADLAAGVYLVKSGNQTKRLTVE